MTFHAEIRAGRGGEAPLPEASDLINHLPCKVLAIKDLRDPFSARERIEDPAHVRLLAEAESALEPILVHHPSMRVIDGVHRMRAAVLRGQTEITARLFDGSEEDAFVLSVQLNVRHGLPLTLSERKAAARRILGSHPYWSDRAIAERTGLSAKTVGKVRRRLDGEVLHLGARLGRDGKIRPLRSVEGRRNAAALLEADSGLSLRELSRKTGLSVGTVRDVRERLGRGQDPVPDRLRKGPQAAVPRRPAPVPAGSGGRALPPGAPRGEHGPSETAPVVQKLARDPSLRATESGRLLLRVLLATELGPAQWEEIAEVIPAHCVPLVRAVMLKRCEQWNKLASMMPRRPEKTA